MSRNRVVGGFEDAFESGQGAVTTAVKQTAKDFTVSAKGQITGGSTTASSQPHQSPQSPLQGSSDQGTSEHGSAAQNSHQATDPKTDEERKKFLSDLYGKSDHGEKDKSGHSDSSKTGAVKQALGVPEKDPNKGLSPEEIAKLTALRNQLHSKYYQDLTAPKQEEVSVTEKLEREDQVERMDAFEKDKKKPTAINPTLKQGTAESVVGVSG